MEEANCRSCASLKPAAGVKGMNAGREQGFVGVDVADAGQYSLIKQDALDRPRGFQSAQSRQNGYLAQRLRAQPGAGLAAAGPQAHAAELARVDKMERRAVVEGERHAQVLAVGSRQFQHQFAGHAQVDGKKSPFRAFQPDIFAAPEKSGDGHALQTAAEFTLGTIDRTRPEQADRGHGFADNMSAQFADDGFYFRQLGHGRPV